MGEDSVLFRLIVQRAVEQKIIESCVYRVQNAWSLLLGSQLLNRAPCAESWLYLDPDPLCLVYPLQLPLLKFVPQLHPLLLLDSLLHVFLLLSLDDGFQDALTALLVHLEDSLSYDGADLLQRNVVYQVPVLVVHVLVCKSLSAVLLKVCPSFSTGYLVEQNWICLFNLGYNLDLLRSQPLAALVLGHDSLHLPSGQPLLAILFRHYQAFELFSFFIYLFGEFPPLDINDKGLESGFGVIVVMRVLRDAGGLPVPLVPERVLPVVEVEVFNHMRRVDNVSLCLGSYRIRPFAFSLVLGHPSFQSVELFAAHAGAIDWN